MMLKPVRTVFAAVTMMLALGSIYAWSIFVPRLVADYGFSTGQTQLIFGVFIAVFTVAMVFGRSLLATMGAKRLALLASGLYTVGFLSVPVFGIHFPVMLLGISIFAGVATGFGYLISITIPVEWYPQKKGLVTGLVSAGFGGGAIVESMVVQELFVAEVALPQVFLLVGLSKGVILAVASFFIHRPSLSDDLSPLVPMNRLLRQSQFLKLFLGIFTGTFAGLLVIGNLKPIGEQFPIDETTLVLGITVFSVANFSGRLFWGWLNDFVSGNVLIPLSLLLMGIFTLLIGLLHLSPLLYLAISFAVGFSFGANFVIYAKETAQIYGLNNLGKIYPFVFLGYGVSGFAGPFTGGVLRDISGNYQNPVFVAFVLCMVVFLAMILFFRKQTGSNAKNR
ncbi:MFS transporter [Marinilabilia salmonicolor]|uniref:OFA family oxalate/formate antiporter-like MFS transporter n=1 Tax=Marinilabilia salmonicolor TaxID=989 RepID=A0A368V2D9_9BACT|nr:MFS transporter [Marinilabilia salmonicolor]RCW34525.1 OFA family oxalate/formate antiporter-like MFS transporter [Marinilabilia salmonicolor]